MLIFGAAKQVASIGKGWDPAAADLHRVPTDMVDMQVRADHGIDPFPRKAGGGESLQKRQAKMVPKELLWPALVIAH